MVASMWPLRCYFKRYPRARYQHCASVSSLHGAAHPLWCSPPTVMIVAALVTAVLTVTLHLQKCQSAFGLETRGRARGETGAASRTELIEHFNEKSIPYTHIDVVGALL